MKHIDSLRKHGYPVTLGKRGLRMHKDTPPELQAKIKAKSSIIVRELIEENDPPLITMMRQRRKAYTQVTKCGNCGGEVQPQPLNDSNIWLTYTCGDCGETYATPTEGNNFYDVHPQETTPRLIQDTVLLYGDCTVHSQTLGEDITIIADDTITTETGAVTYTLQELLRIDPPTVEAIKQLHAAKKAFAPAQVEATKPFPEWKEV